MKTLVVLEERDGGLVAGAFGLLAKARELGGPVAALLCGAGLDAAATQAAANGADHVLVADSARLSDALAQPRVDVVAELIGDGGFDTLILENSSLGADIAGALSVRLEAGVNWDLVDIGVEQGQLTGTRLALSDSVQVTVGWASPVRIAVMRRGVLQSLEPVCSAGAVIHVSPTLLERSTQVRLVERLGGKDADTALDQAEIVVAGGRGLHDQGQLVLLEKLAGKLGGAVAVTMPLVDRGWYPYSHQVGQTGKLVRPRLYVACGISGAIQHRVGMENSGTIVAINTDATAPIFGFADVAVIADLHEFVPRLMQALDGRMN